MLSIPTHSVFCVRIANVCIFGLIIYIAFSKCAQISVKLLTSLAKNRVPEGQVLYPDRNFFNLLKPSG